MIGWNECRLKYKKRAEGSELMGREAEQLRMLVRDLYRRYFTHLISVNDDVLVNADMYILDMCCGVGQYYKVLKPIGDIYYTGMDKDSKMIEMAREVYAGEDGATFLVQDIYDSFGENLYDVVLCINALRHLEDYHIALTNLFTATKKFLIVRTSLNKGQEVIKEYRIVDPDYAREIFSSEDSKVPYFSFPLSVLVSICNDVSQEYYCKVKCVEDRIVILEKIYYEEE